MKLQNLAPERDGAVLSAPVTASVELHEHQPTGLYRLGFAYGKFIHKTRWIVISLWIVALAISVPFAMRLPSILTGGGNTVANSESGQVSEILANTFHQSSAQLLVVFQSANTAVSDPAYQREISNFISRAKGYPHVEQVMQDGTSNDGKTTLVVVSFDNQAPNPEHSVSDFRAMLPKAGTADPARSYITGEPAVDATYNQITAQDTGSAEEKALPIALLVLIIVFGTLVAALLPLVLAVVAVPVALALIYAIALHTQTSVFVLNIASIVGLGISIDYSLFMTRRFRDELACGRSVDQAIGWTVSTAGEAILFSGLTVIIGFCGLLLIGLPFMTSFGIGGAMVVAASVLAALTLLPALLSVLGGRVNSLRLPGLGRLTMPKPQTASRGFWQHWALGVMKRPVLIVVAVGALLLLLGSPLFSINIGTSGASSLPANTEASQGLAILTKQFPSTDQNPVVIVVSASNGTSMLTAHNLASLDALSHWVASRSHIVATTSLTSLPAGSGLPKLSTSQLIELYTSGAYKHDPALAQLEASTTRGNTTIITAYADTKMDSPQGKEVITDLRAGDQHASGGLQALVGGAQAGSMDFNNYLYGNFPKAIVFILVATFFLLLLMFRSLLLPLKAVLMNVLSVSAAYGMLVFIFQEGHLSSLLGFTPEGFVDSTIPILLFCILFGLSMDYEVFLLSRIQEEWLSTHNNRRAVARGLEKTGGVITNAALLFVIVTGAFTFTRLVITKEIGLGMTVAVLVDATIIRTLLVPATMRLVGRWNWWLPGRPLPVEREIDE
ncbi:MAG: MMPL family transporter [Ktedonobacterales bacterium]